MMMTTAMGSRTRGLIRPHSRMAAGEQQTAHKYDSSFMRSSRKSNLFGDCWATAARTHTHMRWASLLLCFSYAGAATEWAVGTHIAAKVDDSVIQQFISATAVRQSHNVQSKMAVNCVTLILVYRLRDGAFVPIKPNETKTSMHNFFGQFTLDAISMACSRQIVIPTNMSVLDERQFERVQSKLISVVCHLKAKPFVSTGISNNCKTKRMHWMSQCRKVVNGCVGSHGLRDQSVGGAQTTNERGNSDTHTQNNTSMFGIIKAKRAV